MSTLPPEIQTKLEDLCRSILSQADVESHRLSVDQFLVNDEARSHYSRVSEQGEHLHHKQMQGVQLSAEEIAEFERQRDQLLNNPVARGFIDAQEAMQGIRESINQFVGKTLELGRMPETGELEGGCGHGCGCHH